MSKQKAIIFDIDGVLINTIDRIKYACKEANIPLRFIGNYLDIEGMVKEGVINNQQMGIFGEYMTAQTSSRHRKIKILNTMKKLDKPFKDAIDFLLGHYSKNHKIILLTGRRKPQQATTRQQLIKFGIPLVQKGKKGKVELYFNTESLKDHEFKAQMIDSFNKKYDVLYFFDDSPANRKVATPILGKKKVFESVSDLLQQGQEWTT